MNSSSFHRQRSPMEPSTCASTDDSLDSFFMSLAIGPDGKTLETGLLGSSWGAAKIMQDGITQSNLKLFARGFEAHVDRVLHGIEPKNEGSRKEEEEKRESKFLHRFEAKEKGQGNDDVGENTKVFSWHEAEDTAKIMQDGITQSNPKLFARGFDAHVDRVLHGIEPKNEDSCKEEEEEEEEEEERESNFLRRFEAKEEGQGNDDDVGENTKVFSWPEAEEEETYTIDPESIIRWVISDEEDEDLVGTQK